VVPAQRAEGATDSPLPLNSFFVAPNVWTKFSIRHPGVSYSEFYRIVRNATVSTTKPLSVSLRIFRRIPRAERPSLENEPPVGRLSET
jgi:hypothetical protein